MRCVGKLLLFVFVFAQPLAAQISVGRPKPLYAPKPEYSIQARARRLEGRGVFLLHTRPDGTVRSVDIIQSTDHPELDQAGVAAFKKWRFRSGVGDVEVPLEFTMRGSRQGEAHAAQSTSADPAGNAYLRAREAYSQQNYDAAIKFASTALQIAPQSFSARYQRGLAYYRKGDIDNAIKDFDEAIRLRPTLAAPHVDRGAAYLAKGSPDKSLAEFNEAIRLDPGDARAYCDRADVEDHRLQQPDKALADYNQAIRLAPDFPRAYFNRGAHFAEQHDYQRAIADYTSAIRLVPNDLGAYAARANAYAKQGDRDRALADAKRAVKLKPTTVMYQWQATDHALRAKAHWILGQPDLALRDLREAVRIAPKDAEANNSLAWLLATYPEARLRNGAEAVAAAQRACELSQWKSSDCIDTLAAACAEAGDFNRATKYEQQALDDHSLSSKPREDREVRLRLYQQRKPYRDELVAR